MTSKVILKLNFIISTKLFFLEIYGGQLALFWAFIVQIKIDSPKKIEKNINNLINFL
jgi:hypothetical protein